MHACMSEAVSEFVVRELHHWTFPDEFPPGWNTTLADLFADSKESRSPIGPTETEWARSYERSLLRSWARFPLDGDVYEAVEDTAVKFLTHWLAPFTDGAAALCRKAQECGCRFPTGCASRLVCTPIPSMPNGSSAPLYPRRIGTTRNTEGLASQSRRQS